MALPSHRRESSVPFRYISHYKTLFDGGTPSGAMVLEKDVRERAMPGALEGTAVT